jgi:hypothetical protein
LSNGLVTSPRSRLRFFALPLTFWRGLRRGYCRRRRGRGRSRNRSRCCCCGSRVTWRNRQRAAVRVRQASRRFAGVIRTGLETIDIGIGIGITFPLPLLPHAFRWLGQGCTGHWRGWKRQRWSLWDPNSLRRSMSGCLGRCGGRRVVSQCEVTRRSLLRWCWRGLAALPLPLLLGPIAFRSSGLFLGRRWGYQVHRCERLGSSHWA